MGLKPFEIKHTALDSGILVLTLSGTMTMGDQLQKFEGTVKDLAKNQQSRIVVDMSGISYIDSTAIGALVSCHSVLKNSRGQMRLAALQERVAKIVQLCGVDRILHIDPNQDAAVAGFPSPAASS